jgi:uncharacterized membrane protein YciS (DUF1049 family)
MLFLLSIAITLSSHNQSLVSADYQEPITLMSVSAMIATVSSMGTAMTIADWFYPDASRQCRDDHQQNGEFE